MKDRAISDVGQEVIIDTAAHTGNFYALQITADAVISAVTYDAGYTMGEKDWTDLGTVTDGTMLMGHFTSVTLASGKAIAHRR